MSWGESENTEAKFLKALQPLQRMIDNEARAKEAETKVRELEASNKAAGAKVTEFEARAKTAEAELIILQKQARIVEGKLQQQMQTNQALEPQQQATPDFNKFATRECSAAASSAAHKPLPTLGRNSQIKFPPETKTVIVQVGVSAKITAPLSEEEFIIAIEPLHSRMLSNSIIAACMDMSRCSFLHAMITTSFGIAQPEPKSAVQKTPLQTLMNAIPSALNIRLCSFDLMNSNMKAVKSAGATLRRCQTVELQGAALTESSEIVPLLLQQGFTASSGNSGVYSRTTTVTNTDAADDVKFPIESIRLTYPDITKQVILDIGLASEVLGVDGGGDREIGTLNIDASQKEMSQNHLMETCNKKVGGNCIMMLGAVSNALGLVQFWQTKRLGGNSIDIPDTAKWPMELGASLVPVMPLELLMDAIPDKFPLAKCKTDTNGNDHRVIWSANTKIKRCPSLDAEFITNGEAGPVCQRESALAIMDQMGFESHDCEITEGKLYADCFFSPKSG